MPWSRRLDPNQPAPNPRLLDGKKPSYQIFIEHILPNPIPRGATQFWQVVECTTLIIDKDCNLSIKKDRIIDIVNIGGRRAIGDNLALIIHADHCFVWEYCVHTVGFDDPTANFAQQTNVKVTEKLADDLKKRMRGPTSTFITSYAFNAGNCCESLKKLLFFGLDIPTGERLHIEGVGDYKWPPDEGDEKNKEDKKKSKQNRKKSKGSPKNLKKSKKIDKVAAATSAKPRGGRKGK